MVVVLSGFVVGGVDVAGFRLQASHRDLNPRFPFFFEFSKKNLGSLLFFYAVEVTESVNSGRERERI